MGVDMGKGNWSGWGVPRPAFSWVLWRCQCSTVKCNSFFIFARGECEKIEKRSGRRSREQEREKRGQRVEGGQKLCAGCKVI